jgi:D-alanyl-D-alanine carboxypeptidase
VADRTRPSDLVPITRRAVSAPGSGVGLLPVGHRVRVEILLYGLLLPSGNDAAVALAQYVGHGSVARFVADMNAEARRQGLRCTHYSSPNGYEDRGNTSCTTDLALLAREVLSRPRLARIVRTTQASFPFLLPRAAKKGRRRVKVLRPGRLYLATHNPLLLDDFPGTIGVKTGYTPAAGACLVAAVRRRGVTLGAVLLDSPDPGGQAERLLDRGFAALRRAHRTRA